MRKEQLCKGLLFFYSIMNGVGLKQSINITKANTPNTIRKGVSGFSLGQEGWNKPITLESNKL